jgi:hypothetical protein
MNNYFAAMYVYIEPATTTPPTQREQTVAALPFPPTLVSFL